MKPNTKWCIPVTRDLDAKVETAVKEGRFISKSELVRAGVRSILEHTKGGNSK